MRNHALQQKRYGLLKEYELAIPTIQSGESSKSSHRSSERMARPESRSKSKAIVIAEVATEAKVGRSSVVAQRKHVGLGKTPHPFLTDESSKVKRFKSKYRNIKIKKDHSP